MTFDQAEVRPGVPVKLTVKGAPHSRIAVAAVDKSIHFLAKANDLKVNEVSKLMPEPQFHLLCENSEDNYFFLNPRV